MLNYPKCADSAKRQRGVWDKLHQVKMAGILERFGIFFMHHQRYSWLLVTACVVCCVFWTTCSSRAVFFSGITSPRTHHVFPQETVCTWEIR